MKKFLLFVAAVLTSATMNAQTWAEAPVSSGFNFDAICESESAAPTQRGPLDTHGSQLVTADVPGVMDALPSDGFLELENGHAYEFGPYSGNNCLVLLKEAEYPTDVVCTEGTLTLKTNVQGSQLGFLFVTANKENYNIEFDVTPVYTDGEGTAQSFSLTNDWGQNPSNKVYSCNRWRVTAGSNPETGFSGALQEEVIDLDSSKTLKAVKFTYQSNTKDAWGWHYINIFGLCVNKSTTGINDLTVDENDAVQSVYTVDGRQVSETQKGINVVKKANGKTVKVIRK